MSNFPPAPLAALRAAELPPAEVGRGDKEVGSVREAAVTAAADEEDTEEIMTGAAGVESAGEAAVAEPED